MEMSGEIGERALNSAVGLGGNNQQLIGLRLLRLDWLRSLFKHNVCVCAADA